MNASSVYYIEIKGEELFTAVGQHDDGITYDEYGVATFTGVYFNKLKNIRAEKIVIEVENMFGIEQEKISYDTYSVPLKIYRGTMLPSKNENGK